MKRVECLDGLRGVAALWVLVGHAMLLTGWRVRVIGAPDLGVDLFIMLSGFLMTHQALGAPHGSWQRAGTWIAFWIRRLFRIAPVYYILLLIAFALGPWIYHDRLLIDASNGVPQQLPTRYLDAGWLNIVAHLTFVFGALPDYSFRTPLPDWSIGLEMQFYLAFPVIAITAARFGWHAAVAAFVLVGMISAWSLGAADVVFPMPSLLALKAHMFACGMICAIAAASERKLIALACIGAALTLVPFGGDFDKVHRLVRLALFGVFFLLTTGVGGRSTQAAANLLSHGIARRMGDYSYSVYLVHLLVMHKLATMAIANLEEHWLRFVVVCGGTLLASVAIGALLHRYVELPGQELGRSISRRMQR